MFSVIVATRNRPAVLAEALQSIRAQQGTDYEIVVIDDGTEERFAAELASIESRLAGVGRMVHLPRRNVGHGQSYAINAGAAIAHGEYLCFLDDDDVWIDPAYLSMAHAIIADSRHPPDLLYFQQRARQPNGSILEGSVWIEHLETSISRTCRATPRGAFEVDVQTLMRSGNFCHLNTSIVRREFFSRIGGLAEHLRYENDRDFYLRSIDSADRIIYAPFMVAEHRIPDREKKANMSTSYNQYEKWVAQLLVFSHASLLAKNPLIRQFGRLQRGYTEKKIAMSFVTERRYREAIAFALDGLASGFTLRWLGVTTLIALGAALSHFFRPSSPARTRRDV